MLLTGWTPCQVRGQRDPHAGHPQRDGHHPLVAAARQRRKLRAGRAVLQGTDQEVPLPQVQVLNTLQLPLPQLIWLLRFGGVGKTQDDNCKVDPTFKKFETASEVVIQLLLAAASGDLRSLQR